MAQTGSPELDLLRRFACGDEKAFDVLYGRYHKPIFRFAWHMSGNQATAEDVTQEVFIRLIRDPHSYDPLKGSLSAYLYGIARHVTSRATERHSRMETMPEDAFEEMAQMTDDCDTLAELTRNELLDDLRKALLALPELYREALVMCELQELSYAEAAAILQCPAGTVASRVHRAKAMLKAKLSCQGCTP
jgi:RNA polymerase sigma-70 factor (ECF subfamily)